MGKWMDSYLMVQCFVTNVTGHCLGNPQASPLISKQNLEVNNEVQGEVGIPLIHALFFKQPV